MIYTQRIFWPSYNTPEKLSHVLAFLKEHRDVCDQISFFTEGDGQDWRYVPLDEVQRRAAFLKGAVQQAREAGFVPDINVLNTMGHSDEGGTAAPSVPWQTLVGHRGEETRHCCCPFDAAFLEYVTAKYRAFAACEAEKYWIDDDVRLWNHSPAEWGCFCAQCLADYNTRSGRGLSREQLVSALGTDLTVRAEWVARNNSVMMGVLEACAAGVGQGSGGADIGFMTCEILHDWAADMPQCFQRLSALAGGESWLRPGGGFWTDESPRSVLHKIHAVGDAIAAVPNSVRTLYEVENYPFIQGAKSATMTGLECLLVVLATRLDGIMFDILDPAGNDLAPFEQWVTDLRGWKPLWEEASRLVAGTTPLGWRPAFSPNHFANFAGADLGSMRTINHREPLALQPAGLPVTAFAEGARGHLLGSNAARGMTVEELEALLEKPLILDGGAAARFVEVGLGERIGVASLATYSEGVYERFTQHELNGAAFGYGRTATLKYFSLQSYAIEPTDGTEVLSELCDYAGKPLGAALTLHRSGAGATAILGHLPWQHVLSPQRIQQLQNLSHSLLGLGAQLRSNRPVTMWLRAGAGPDGAIRHLAVLFNAGFDIARDVALTLPGAPTLALSSGGVEMRAHENGCTLTIPGWSVAVVECAAG